MRHYLCTAAYHTKRSGIACLVLLSVMSYVPTANAIFHLWDINEVYSNADGTIQYIELHTNSNGQQFLSGHHLHANDADGDSIGDIADTDDDDDGVPDSSDSFPTDSTRTVDADSVDFRYRSPINYFQGIDEYNNQSILQVSSLSDQVNRIKLALFDENGTPYDYATAMGSGFSNHAGDGKQFTFILSTTVADSAGELEGIAHGY